MGKHNSPEGDHNGLEQEVAELTMTVKLLVNAIDELREQLQWVAYNGFPDRQDLQQPFGVLKRMAADPNAEDWEERLEIVREQPTLPEQQENPAVEPTTENTTAPSPSSKGTLF